MLAFCNALESMAFCDGCFERLGFLCDEVESVLLLSPWDRLLECPFSRYAAPSSVCGMVASRLKAEVGREGSGVARGEVDRYEVSPALEESSQKVPDSLSAPGPGKYVARSGFGSRPDKAAPTRSSCDREGSCTMGGRVVSGGTAGCWWWRSSGDPPAVEGRFLCSRLGEAAEEDCEKSAVESMLMRREKRFAEAGLDARLEEVEMDHLFRFRKPSLRPPRLLDREWDLEWCRRVFFGETESSNSRSFTGSAGTGTAAEAFEKGSWRAVWFQLDWSTVRLGGGSSEEVRGREADEKEGVRLTAEDMWEALLAMCEGLVGLYWAEP